VLYQSSGIFSNFGAENPPLLQAAKRWQKWRVNANKIEKNNINRKLK
jgi:hypothetical protein